MKRAFRLAIGAALASSVGLAACSESRNPATGRSEYTTISPAQESKIGAEEHPKVLKEFGGAYNEGGVGSYVSSIGQRLVANSELAGQRFTFTVLDSPIVNAFALPGGYVYVTRGLIALANDEAELAGVIGHEIGHVTGRHTAQRQTRGTVAGLGALAATIGAAALGVDPRSVGQIAQTVAKGYVASFSRNQELEADRFGVRYISRTGYDPYAQSDFLASMQRQSELAARLKGKTRDPNQVSFFNTHPSTPQRVREAIGAAQASGVPINSGAPRNRDGFLRVIDGMTYGDNTKDGFVRGNGFYHVPFDFAITAPPSYEIVNTDKAVIFKSERTSNVGAQFDADKRTTGDMLAYLNKATGGKGKNPSRFTTQGGMNGATVTGTATNNGRRYAIRLVAIDAGDKIYRFKFIAPSNVASRYDGEFRQIATSVRRLTASERANLRPYRIRIHRVGYGETAESLAARTPFEEMKVERFRVLNGLAPGQQPRPGQLVKLVQ